MSHMHQGSSSIQLSSELTCQVVPMIVERTPQFSSIETRFFKEGDELAIQTMDEFNELFCVKQPGRLSRLRWPLAGAILAAASVAGLVLLWSAQRKPRLPHAEAVVAAHPAPVQVPIAAQTKVVAEAPAAARPIPSPPQVTAGAMAASATDEARDACRKAFDQHRTKDVLSVCAQAFEAVPPSAKVAVMLAKTEFERGRPRQALEWAQKAIAIDADHADAYVFLGSAEQAAGRATAAKAAYKRYLQLAPQGRYASDLRAVLASL